MVVAATMLNNSHGHETTGSTSSQVSRSVSVTCRLCGKTTTTSVNHDGENYCQECVGKLLDVVSDQKKAAASEASRSLDNTTVEYLDEQFKAWERGEKDKVAKLGESAPQVADERPIEKAVDIVDEDDDEDDEDDGDDDDRVEEMDLSSSGRTKTRSVTRYPRYCYKTRRSSEKTKQVALMAGMMVALGIGMYFAWPLFGSSLIAAPAYSGPFTGATIHVVDGDSGTDISGQISTFDLYVTNDTEDYGAYWWIGNGTTIAGMYQVLGSIDDGLHYSSVVLYTDVYPPYADSWDYLLPGENYVYVYK